MSTVTHAATARPLSQTERELVETNLKLVHGIARAWRARCRSSLDHADLVQVGALALTEAARRYDPSRNVTFAGMAAERIRGAIRDHLRSIDPLSRLQRSSLRELQAGSAQLANRLGRRPEAEELAEELGWTLERVQSVCWLSASLAQGWAQTQEATETTTFAPPGTAGAVADPQEQLLQCERKEELMEALESLPERERLVLDLYFREEMKLAEIGEILGVTESRISQLRTAALQRLQRRLGARAAAAAV